MKMSPLTLMLVTILASSAVACAAETPSNGGLEGGSHGSGSSDTAGGASHGTPSSGAPASMAASPPPAASPAPPAASTAPPTTPPATPPALTPTPAKMACATLTDAVTAAYEIALLRAPDAAGLSYWVVRLQGGQTRLAMLESFLRSDEFSSARAGLDDTQFVTSLYVGLLGRAPDAAGLAYYLDALANRGLSRKDVAVAFVEGPEFADPAKNPAYACFF